MLKKKSALKKIKANVGVRKVNRLGHDKTKNPVEEKLSSSEKIRIVISCTEDEKMYVKMLAAKERMTISDYLLSFARQRMPKSRCNLPGCGGIHKPNKLTEKVLKESARGENLEHHDSVEDFWESMGIDPNA
jgi:hypothetical protein